MNHHKNVCFKTIRGYFPFHAKDEFLSPAELLYSPAAPTRTKRKENTLIKSKQPSRVKANYKKREGRKYVSLLSIRSIIQCCSTLNYPLSKTR